MDISRYGIMCEMDIGQRCISRKWIPVEVTGLPMKCFKFTIGMNDEWDLYCKSWLVLQVWQKNVSNFGKLLPGNHGNIQREILLFK